MSDDEDRLRGTIPFEDIDILMDADIEGEEALLDSVEDGQHVLEATDPFLPALPQATRQHRVSDELIARTMENDEGWMTCYAVVGNNGILRLRADVFERLQPGERVEVRVRRARRQRDD